MEQFFSTSLVFLGTATLAVATGFVFYFTSTSTSTPTDGAAASNTNAAVSNPNVVPSQPSELSPDVVSLVGSLDDLPFSSSDDASLLSPTEPEQFFQSIHYGMEQATYSRMWATPVNQWPTRYFSEYLGSDAWPGLDFFFEAARLGFEPIPASFFLQGVWLARHYLYPRYILFRFRRSPRFPNFGTRKIKKKAAMRRRPRLVAGCF